MVSTHSNSTSQVPELPKQVMAKRKHESHKFKTEHGRSPKAILVEGVPSQEHPLYSIWLDIRRRCYKPYRATYKYYGGRGIKMCEEWRISFAAFVRDMGARPSSKYSIDRTDNNRDYEPSNCRWVEKLEQANNTRFNRLLEYDGRTQTMAQWCREYGIDQEKFRKRLKRGWTMEQALSNPKGKMRLTKEEKQTGCLRQNHK